MFKKNYFDIKKCNRNKKRFLLRFTQYRHPLSLLFKIKQNKSIIKLKLFSAKAQSVLKVFLVLFRRGSFFLNKNIQFLVYYCFTFFFISLCRRRHIIDNSLRARLFLLFNTLLNGTYNLLRKHFYLTGPFWLSIGFSAINITRFFCHYRFIISMLYLFLGRFVKVSTLVLFVKSINFFTLKRKFFNLRKIYYYLIPGLSQFRKLTKKQNLYVKKLRLFIMCASNRKRNFFKFFPVEKVLSFLQMVSKSANYFFSNSNSLLPSYNLIVFYRKSFIYCLKKAFKDFLYKLRANIPFYKTARQAFSSFIKKTFGEKKQKSKRLLSIFFNSIFNKNPGAGFISKRKQSFVVTKLRKPVKKNIGKKSKIFISNKKKSFYRFKVSLSSDFYRPLYKNSVFLKLPLKIPYVIRDKKSRLLKIFSVSSNKFSKLLYPAFLYKQKFFSLKKFFGKKVVKLAFKKRVNNILYLKRNYKLFSFLKDKFSLFCSLDALSFKKLNLDFLKNKKVFISFLHSFLLRKFFKKTLYRFIGFFSFIFKVIYRLYIYKSFFFRKIFVFSNFLHENFYFSKKPYVKNNVLSRPILTKKRVYRQSLKNASGRSFMLNKRKDFLFCNNFFLDKSRIIFIQPILKDYYRLGYKLHINNTIGNIFLNLINLKNRTVKFTSAGMLGFKQKKKRLPLALESAGKELGAFFGSRIRRISVKNFFIIASTQTSKLSLNNILKGFFVGYQTATKDVNLNFFQKKKQFSPKNYFRFFLFVGKKIAHNGCRPKKARRV
jgi:hypothetical protein